MKSATITTNGIDLHFVEEGTQSLRIPGAGHWVQQEAPDVVNAALLEFMR